MTVFQCSNCDKVYKHKQSLFRHKKNCKVEKTECKKSKSKHQAKHLAKHQAKHKLSIKTPKKCLLLSDNFNKTSQYFCIFCNKAYKHYQSRYRHQKNCEYKEVNKIDNEVLITKTDMDNKIKAIKHEMLEMFNKEFKMHHKTFDKLKRDLANNNCNNNSNNTTNINNTTNNLTINNNINIIPLGKEDFINTLNREDQKRVVNSLYNSIKYLCNLTHFNPETPQYHNFVITNNQNNIAYIYDDKQKKFKVITKDELIFDLIHERGSDIRDFIEFNEEELRGAVCKRVKDFIDRLDTDRKYLKKKGNELKALIYSNTRDKEINNLNALKN